MVFTRSKQRLLSEEQDKHSTNVLVKKTKKTHVISQYIQPSPPPPQVHSMITRSKLSLEVNIDFDEASKAWRENKTYIGNGCFQYT